MVEKINTLTTKTIKVAGIQGARAMVSLCPGNLESADKMMSAGEMKKVMPLVDVEEWERYTAGKAMNPAPSTTSGRVAWWNLGHCSVVIRAPRPPAGARGGGLVSLSLIR